MSEDTNAGRLFAVDTAGNWWWVENNYDSIKHALDQATLDFIGFGEVGAYVDDNGMIEAKALNVPASLMFGMVLYGPVVLCAGHPDDKGDSLPPPPLAVHSLKALAEQWTLVIEDGGRKGQSVEIRADAESIPPPQIITFESDEDFMLFLGERSADPCPAGGDHVWEEHEEPGTGRTGWACSECHAPMPPQEVDE